MDLALTSLVNERDKKIQLEIKNLQIDLIKWERSYSSQLEKQKRITTDSEGLEASLSERRQATNKTNISELVLQRDSVVRAESDARQAVHELELRLISLRKELSVYEEGVDAYVQRAGDVEDECRELQTTQRRIGLGNQADQQNRVQLLQSKLTSLQHDGKRAIELLDQQHKSELDKLNSQVLKIN